MNPNMTTPIHIPFSIFSKELYSIIRIPQNAQNVNYWFFALLRYFFKQIFVSGVGKGVVRTQILFNVIPT